MTKKLFFVPQAQGRSSWNWRRMFSWCYFCPCPKRLLPTGACHAISCPHQAGLFAGCKQTQRAFFEIITLIRALLVLNCGFEADPEEYKSSSRHSAIVNGALDQGHPAVGFLTFDGKHPSCTASLIGSHTILTAGHCAYSGGTIEFEGQRYKVEKITAHPQFVYKPVSTNDLAVGILAKAVIGIQPVKLSHQAPLEGQTITLVGFGVSSFSAKDIGTKRLARNTIAQVQKTIFS